MAEENKLEDVCKECQGKRAIEDMPLPTCGDESALFYALHKDKTKVTGKYQKINSMMDVFCIYTKRDK